MADDRFYIDPEEEAPYKEKSTAAGCLKGCLIVFGVVFVVLLLLTWWVSRNWQRWAADMGADVLNEVVDQSEMPDEEKAEVKVEITRLADAFGEGQISGEQLATAIEQLVESPLFTSIIVSSVEHKYLEPSGLDDEEKTAGRVALRRFVRGMVDKKIAEADFEQAFKMIAEEKGNGEWELRESITDDELRQLIALVEQKSDAAEIPAEVEEVDISDEMRRIVDETLGVGALPEAEPPQE